MIDWRSAESHLLLNPRMPAGERTKLESYVTALPAHVWLATSGSTGALKLVALSKRAFLASAAAVNRHIAATSRDVWCCVLPTFHVGGLAIHARAHLSRARVVTATWDPLQFAAIEEMSLTALVPAQVTDLIAQRVRAPGRLRAVIVGGGALTGDTYAAGKELGWPLLPSYGMTECASQVATARTDAPDLALLDHFEARTERDGRLALRGEALLTGYGTAEGFFDPKNDGWFVTDDLATVEHGYLHVSGRVGDFVKIGGESVDLTRLARILERIAGPHAAILPVPDQRLGHVIHIVVDSEIAPDAVAAAFAEEVHPFERARAVHIVDQIVRSPLGKVLRKQLADAICRPLE